MSMTRARRSSHGFGSEMKHWRIHDLIEGSIRGVIFGSITPGILRVRIKCDDVDPTLLSEAVGRLARTERLGHSRERGMALPVELHNNSTGGKIE